MNNTINRKMLDLINQYVREYGDEVKFRYVKEFLHENGNIYLCLTCKFEMQEDGNGRCSKCDKDYNKIITFMEACRGVAWELDHLSKKLDNIRDK